MKTLKNILEASILDIEGSIQKGNDYDKYMKIIEKDWKKLLKTKRYAHSAGDQWCIKIKSPELARFFGECIEKEVYEKYKDYLSLVAIVFYTTDALPYNESYIRELTLQIRTDLTLFAQAKIPYCDDVERITSKADGNFITIKDACDSIIDVIQNSSLLKDINKVKETFNKNITYKRR